MPRSCGSMCVFWILTSTFSLKYTVELPATEESEEKLPACTSNKQLLEDRPVDLISCTCLIHARAHTLNHSIAGCLAHPHVRQIARHHASPAKLGCQALQRSTTRHYPPGSFHQSCGGCLVGHILGSLKHPLTRDKMWQMPLEVKCPQQVHAVSGLTA